MLTDTLNDLHIAFATRINEQAPPNNTDSRYTARTLWFNDAREDIAKRWFLRSLLKKYTISIQVGTATYALPSDFEKQNGLRVFYLENAGILLTDPYDTSGTLLSLARNFNTGLYEITITPTPQTSDTATLWYFATPPKLVNPTDLCLVDSAAVLYYALKEHSFANRRFSQMEIARQEYENRVEEIIKNDTIPAPGELIGTGTRYSTYKGDHKRYYGGNTRRS